MREGGVRSPGPSMSSQTDGRRRLPRAARSVRDGSRNRIQARAGVTAGISDREFRGSRGDRSSSSSSETAFGSSDSKDAKEWLDDDRKTYLTEGSHKLTLTPLSSDEGVSMIVVPAPGEDATNPSKVYCIEVAQYLRPSKKMPKPRGVLVYSIDATKPTGINPNILYPRQDKINAAYHEGDAFEHDDAPFSLRVIEKNDGDSYEVEVVVK